ncbi:Tm-1-like ATP-binding domain-containing protein [Amycolatopsis sp., V23-08]|uniref:Tm-1-like ATP-binding domain-containing protein n=1 Tax=Amycolatopsis heterodermiae TaxID=3110235 RepID=A0ABU5RM67_9PSEU|nr:Tm-1-like ATP-binding domain-containing protein [Amycolatopsis sp., V23-08]MEA5367393.1 Tm-1-like ATP-binding domain-containing protein [Amycolatopsis sp., V23-08]
MATVVLLGTLDTKGAEYAWLRERLAGHGVDVLTVDAGSFSASPLADVSSDEVIAAAGGDAGQLRDRRDRGEMMTVLAAGAAAVVRDLHGQGRLHGLLAVGGSGGSSVAAPAMQALPVGVPKLLVSTMASGDVQPYVGEVDATLMYSVVDVAGINSVSAAVLGNAAAGIAAMAQAYEARTGTEEHAPLVGLTMFGVTTPAADEARERLTALGYEVLVFHATGTGGRAMEKLVASGMLAGVCDLTTTELCDDLVGGVLSAGPDRLEVAGRLGVPQVVSLGALDMVNFGPRETLPAQFESRNVLVHNPTVTLVRTTAGEMAELGRRIARKLAAATGPTDLFIPLRGVSAVDVEGAPFRDADADAALFEALRTGLEGSAVTVHEHDLALNDPGFGAAMAETLHRQLTSTPKER